MISFYPGPSKVYPDLIKYFQEACQSGFLGINHRSEEFVEVVKSCCRLLKEKLFIPDDYTIFFTSSATECWEIIAESVIDVKSIHIFNGSFGRKWWEYTTKLGRKATSVEFDCNSEIGEYTFPHHEVICITQNETSNGTQVKNETIRSIKAKNPDSLIAIDATSSLGGIRLEIDAADIWFASVQKCFGLPAGMALLICSPKAIQRAKKLNQGNHYNSLVYMDEMMLHHQTTYTPNVINIYFLNALFQQIPSIKDIDARIKKRAKDYYLFFSGLKNISPLVNNSGIRSDTVIAITGEKRIISDIKQELKKKGMLLGNGYGPWKETTFRIANFPAMDDEEIDLLKNGLSLF